MKIMRRHRLIAAAWLLLIAGSITPLGAQSLADVAKKEEDRRKKIAEPAKVYTNKDLRPAPPPANQTKGDDKAAADKSKGAADQTADKGADKSDAANDAAAKPAAEPAKDKAYWMDRLKQLQQQLSRDESFALALQSRINGLTTDFVNRDDPAQKSAIERDRQKAIAELDRLKQAIPADKKAIDDFLEEARHAGVPPGWLR